MVALRRDGQAAPASTGASSSTPPAPWTSEREMLMVVLVDVGPSPAAVAALLKEVMNITISDAEALEQAAPLVLFRSLPREEAEAVRSRLKAAGAEVEIRRTRPTPPVRLVSAHEAQRRL